MRRKSKVRVALVAAAVTAMSMLGTGVASANEPDQKFEEARHDCRPPWRDDDDCHRRRHRHGDRDDDDKGDRREERRERREERRDRIEDKRDKD